MLTPYLAAIRTAVLKTLPAFQPLQRRAIPCYDVQAVDSDPSLRFRAARSGLNKKTGGRR